MLRSTCVVFSRQSLLSTFRRCASSTTQNTSLPLRKTWAAIDLDAVAHNVTTLRQSVHPTPFCAVVKADGYGHGAVEVAKTALQAGASWLAVALVEEGLVLREAGLDVPILVLSEPHASAMADVVEHGLTPTVYTAPGISAVAAAAQAAKIQQSVHLCVDSGMRRVGTSLDTVGEKIELIRSQTGLALQAVWTHCPVADDPSNDFTDDQLARFTEAVYKVDPEIPTHVGNSAVGITRPNRPAFMVRFGISIYGIDPDRPLKGIADLRPAMTLRSAVSFVKHISAGEGVGYGFRFVAPRDTTIATVPIGYADGIRRDLGLQGGTVLIRGQHYPIVGVVTMDQLMIDVGSKENGLESPVQMNDEVVFIGSQGENTITAAQVADILSTIPYEVTCAVGKRVPRIYDNDLL